MLSSLLLLPLKHQNIPDRVYFTLPPFFWWIPMDFDQTQPIPIDSARQSVGLDQILLLVQS